MFRLLMKAAAPQVFLSALVLVAAEPTAGQQAIDTRSGTYTNPLPVVSAEHGLVENCSDPEVLEGGNDDSEWYLYCTTNPLRADNRHENGGLGWHLVPMFRSLDMVNWDYVGDAFDRDPETATPPPPASADATADFWAPEVQRIGERFYLLITITNTSVAGGGRPDCKGDSSIGYAVSDGPLGPWRAAEMPLIAPRYTGEGCEGHWTIDPEVFEDEEGRHHVLYGGASGGIEARNLLVAEDGSLSALPSTAIPIAVGNRWGFEGAEVVYRDGLYYLFASTTHCCNGPQTGYTVLVGRSESPTGPFVDRQGASFLDTTVGGTPFLAQNGNRWIGPGHNAVVQDRSGQWWTYYHAVDEDEPYFAGMTGYTKRPLLLDAVTWMDGWPTVNGGAGPSVVPRPAPALQPGEEIIPAAALIFGGEPGPLIPSLSEDFEGAVLSGHWTWLRQPEASRTGLIGGLLRWETRAGDLRANAGDPEDAGDPPVLLLDAPERDFVVEARVRLDTAEHECCPHDLQAGLVVHGDDDNYIKLVLIRVHQTWHTEFAREMGPVPEEYPTYGNSVIGPPGEDWTWLRIAVRRLEREELYTASTSRDGESWVRGTTWTHGLGKSGRIGLVAMGGDGFTAEFDYLRVFELGRRGH